MMKTRSVYICDAVRTPHGGFFGSLKDIPSAKLGASVIKKLLERNKVPPAAVGGVFMGEVFTAGEGQNPARQAVLQGGLPLTCPAETVNKVCASSLAALRNATRAIQLGETELMIAGGMENMSRSPYFMRRKQKALGNRTVDVLVSPSHGDPDVLYDSMLYDGLTDPLLSEVKRQHMGDLADLCAYVHSISREEQDLFSHVSVARAHDARRKGFSALQLFEMSPPGVPALLDDEVLRLPNLSAVRKLRPVFSETGTVTAGTSSQIADGASALLISSGKEAKELSLTPIARICDFAVFSGHFSWYTTAPVGAIKLLLEKTRRTISNIDLFEINEAFAVVPLYAMKEFSLPHEKVNVWGGAIAIGHPLGASGTRIVGALAHQLRALGEKTGIAVACNGGGEAVAVMIERV